MRRTTRGRTLGSTEASLRLGFEVCAAFRGARVLVTGGGGFIGRHLSEALASLGAEVTLVGCQHRTQPSFDARNIVVVQPAPVGSPDFARMLLSVQPFDFIFHLAGRATATGSMHAPADDFASNTSATVALLEQLRLRHTPTRLVYASSAAVYGCTDKLPIAETDATVPVSPYGLSKLASEQYIRLYASLYGLSAASVRPFSVYGPLQTKQVVYNFLRDLARDPADLHVLGTGFELRDFVYVQDVVRAFLTVAVRGRRDGTAYNVATGVGTTIGQLAQVLIEARELPTRLTFSGVRRPGDQDRLLGDPGALTRIGGAPVYSLLHGLRATTEWFDTTVLSGAHPRGRFAEAAV